MSPRGPRQRIATGIFRDNLGAALCVKIAGESFEKRTKGTYSDDELIALRAQWIDELLTGHPRLSKPGTFTKDVESYLQTFPAKSQRKQDADNNLTPWLEPFGKLSRAHIPAMQIRAVMAEWQAKGYAPSTLNHRRQELLNLFTALNGKAGANPVRDVPRIRAVRDEPRGIPMKVARFILKFMRESATKRRLTVILETGLPHAQIARLQKRDFHHKARTIFVRPRRKGAGHPGVTLPLTTRGTAAIADLLKHDAGEFSRDSLRKSFLLAVEKAQARFTGRWKRALPIPANLHPYDLRHCFLSEAYRRTNDLRAVAELALHSDLKMTQRYAEAAVSETARQAIQRMDE